jgi:ABC-type proline/glycine betaine transport system ATPase subunit
MTAIRAHAQNGRIVLDEPLNVPDPFSRKSSRTRFFKFERIRNSGACTVVVRLDRDEAFGRGVVVRLERDVAFERGRGGLGW